MSGYSRDLSSADTECCGAGQDTQGPSAGNVSPALSSQLSPRSRGSFPSRHWTWRRANQQESHCEGRERLEAAPQCTSCLRARSHEECRGPVAAESPEGHGQAPAEAPVGLPGHPARCLGPSPASSEKFEGSRWELGRGRNGK